MSKVIIIPDSDLDKYYQETMNYLGAKYHGQHHRSGEGEGEIPDSHVESLAKKIASDHKGSSGKDVV
jgi:hypothetical protein